jgi:hypothetical protein
VEFSAYSAYMFGELLDRLSELRKGFHFVCGEWRCFLMQHYVLLSEGRRNLYHKFPSGEAHGYVAGVEMVI